MRILGIERDNTACNQFRVLQPIYKMREHGLADGMTINEMELGTDYALQKVLEADIIVFQRPCNDEWFKFIKLCQKEGKTIVLDYDDDPFNTSPMNPFYKFVGTQEAGYNWPTGETDMIWMDGQDGFNIERNIERNDMFRACFRKADLVTTTTDILQQEFKKLNENTLVLPNLVDFNYYPKYEMVKREVRIGYQCGASHYEDLYSVKDAIKEVLESNDNVKFVYFGDYRFNSLLKDLPQDKVEYHEWVRYIAYPYKLPLMNIDIGLCPLVDNTFNRNKSALKFFDYSTQGAATIASNIPPYSPVIKDSETGYLVNDHKGWVDAMNTLIQDKVKRETMGQKALDFVYENYNADKKAHLWAEAYEKVLKKEVTCG